MSRQKGSFGVPRMLIMKLHEMKWFYAIGSLKAGGSKYEIHQGERERKRRLDKQGESMLPSQIAQEHIDAFDRQNPEF